MDRLGSSLALATLLLLPACGDDSPPVGSGTETETGTGSSGTDTSGASMTTTSTTDAMTSDGSSGGSTTNTTNADTTDGTTTVEPTTDGTDTTAGDECDMCIDDNCGGELGDCLADRDCLCWIECLADEDDPQICGMMCGGMLPELLVELIDCVDNDCNAECNGGMGDETYMECMDDADCPTTDCAAGFLGYCTPNCMGDDDNCPAPATGDIMPVCGGMGGNRCILPCGDGGTCPDGMNCTQGPGGNEVCAFN